MLAAFLAFLFLSTAGESPKPTESQCENAVETQCVPEKVVAEQPKIAPVLAAKGLGYYEPIDKSTPVLELKTFDKASVDGFLAKFKELDGKTEEIWVRIDSLGGSVFGGQELIRGMEIAKSNVVCVVDWKAYSMAFYVLQSRGCDFRLMTKRSSLMAHEPSTESGGNAGSLRDDADLLDALNEGFLVTAAERMNMTVAALRAKTERRTWWLDYKGAEKYHAIDGWVDPSDIPAPEPVAAKKSFLELLLGG